MPAILRGEAGQLGVHSTSRIHRKKGVQLSPRTTNSLLFVSAVSLEGRSAICRIGSWLIQPDL